MAKDIVKETILQHWVFTQFVLPFLLIFTIVFAVLQKTKVLGHGKKQLDAIVAFVIGLIFVGVAYPKLVVGNLILFLTVALVVVFVALLLWGFVSGGEAKLEGNTLKVVGGVSVIAIIFAVLWAMGIQGGVFGLLFNQSWSSTFWTNFFFIAVIVVVLAVVIKGGGKSE